MIREKGQRTSQTNVKKRKTTKRYLTQKEKIKN